LIYFPTTFDASIAATFAGRNGLQAWNDEAGQLIGWTRKPGAGGKAQSALLILHGNAGSALHRTYFFDAIRKAGLSRDFDVYVLEYPGYGSRGGAPSESALLKAAEEGCDRLAQLYPNGKIIVLGESLGSGVAALLARARGERVDGVVLVTPFDSLVAVGQRQMPFLPVSLILQDKYEAAKSLQDYRGAIAIVIAERDAVIPPALGERLYQRLESPRKRRWLLEGAGHNDIEYGEPWLREAIEFASGAGAPQEQVPSTGPGQG
jgi:pimeloyl-ACP methyl ester carboxylesterase